MKLVRFGDAGSEKPGILDGDGNIRDLSGHISDIGPEAVTPAGLAKLQGIDVAGLPTAPAGVRIGAPITGMRNFIAVGLNYEDHARETGRTNPGRTHPVQ